MRNTFLPPSPLLAGSMYIMSAWKPESSSSGEVPSRLPLGDTALLLTQMLSAPSMLKLCDAALHKASCISLYSTAEAFREKYHESTPRPPVRSAMFQEDAGQEPFPAILPASSALYAAVALLLHCSAESFEGNISSFSSYHSWTLPLSLRLDSMQEIARSMSISGHLALSRIRRVRLSLRCSATNPVSFSIIF